MIHFLGKNTQILFVFLVDLVKMQTGKTAENARKASIIFVHVVESTCFFFDEIAKKRIFVFIFTIHCDILGLH